MSTAKLLEGKVLAAGIQSEIQEALGGYTQKGWESPHLTAFQVTDDPSAKWYLGQQEKLIRKLGMCFTLIPPQELADSKALVARVREAGQDPDTHGIFITMPLPETFSAEEVLFSLDPRKDVEGIHPANLGLIVLRRARIIPPTAYAAYRLILASELKLRSKKAVIVGQSAIVGRPLQLLLGEQRVTTVVCNTGTSREDMMKAVSESDIVVACAGNPGMIPGAWIKPGAVVIDVGTTEVEGRLKGDVEFETASERAGFITPVPGGVGPLTVTMLVQNLIHAYQWQKGAPR